MTMYCPLLETLEKQLASVTRERDNLVLAANEHRDVMNMPSPVFCAEMANLREELEKAKASNRILLRGR